MKVMMIVWMAALGLAYLVAGRSFEQALLSGKILLVGFVLGFVTARICDTLHASRSIRTRLKSHR